MVVCLRTSSFAVFPSSFEAAAAASLAWLCPCCVAHRIVVLLRMLAEGTDRSTPRQIAARAHARSCLRVGMADLNSDLERRGVRRSSVFCLDRLSRCSCRCCVPHAVRGLPAAASASRLLAPHLTARDGWPADSRDARAVCSGGSTDVRSPRGPPSRARSSPDHGRMGARNTSRGAGGCEK